MFRILAFPLVLLFALPILAEEPSFNGRKMSEWQQMLKEDATPRKRRAAVVALSQIAADNREVLPVVLATLGKAMRNDASPAVREQAAVVLGQLKIEESAALVVPDLTEALRVEQETSVRKELVTAIGRFGKFAKPAVGPVTNALKDSHPEIRATAADALGRIGPDAKAAAPELLKLIKDGDKSVRQSVIFALGRIDPDEKATVAEAFILVLKESPDADLRRESVLALGFLGEKTSLIVQAFDAALSDKEADIRALVALTLAKFGPAIKSAENGLGKAIKSDPDKAVRLNAVRSLCVGLGADAASIIPMLSERLKEDADFEVRVAIAEELGAMGSAAKSALPSLRIAQKDPQIKVREAATKAIKVIEKPEPKPKM